MIDALRITPGSTPEIAARDTRDDLGLGDKEDGKERLGALTGRLFDLQERLYAEGTRGVLLVLQGLDASGKDGVIRSVFTGINPHGVHVTSFGVPTETERAHDYCEWERMLADEGTAIVKVFLHVSREEQRERLQERIDDPAKRWKFRKGDLDVRRRFDEYVAAWEEVIAETSTEWAPWHVVPADRNWVKSAPVAALLVEALERLDPQLPDAEPGLEGLAIA